MRMKKDILVYEEAKTQKNGKKRTKNGYCVNSPLGIHIDEELNYMCHITTIVAKFHVGSVFYTRSKNFFSTSALLGVYYSLEHSHLSYGIIIWGIVYYNSQLGSILLTRSN